MTPFEWQQTCLGSRTFASYKDGDLKNLVLDQDMTYKAAGYWWAAGTNLARTTNAAAETTAANLVTADDQAYTYRMVDSAIALTVGAAAMSTLYSMTY